MARTLAIIGGILALLGALGSIFLGFLGWYNFDITTTVYGNLYLGMNAIGGATVTATGLFATIFDPSMVPLYATNLGLIAGILVMLGGVLCLTSKKSATIGGGVLILAGVGIFFVNLLMSAGDMAASLGPLLGLSSMDMLQMLWFTQDIPGVGSVFFHIGYGLIIAAVGGILGLIGARGSD